MPLPFKQIRENLLKTRKETLNSHETALKVELRSIERMRAIGTLSPQGKIRETEALKELQQVRQKQQGQVEGPKETCCIM